MKSLRCLLTLVALAAVVTGCSKEPSNKVVAQQLQTSFAGADVPVKDDVIQAAHAVQAGNYAAAVASMDRAVQKQPMSEAQRQAVAVFIGHTRKAIEQSPNLNSPQTYKALSDLTLHTFGEN